MAIIILVVVGLIDLVRRGVWRDLVPLLAAAFCVEMLIVVADMVLGARVGSIMGADAVVHLARIRSLMDHGLSNADPFVAGDFFFPLYHTNLLHALCASAGQLTGVDHLMVWFVSIVWAKLMVASGAYYLAWSVWQRQWPAWVATVFVVACQGPVTFMLYPNKLAPFWLLSIMLAFGVQLGLAPTRKRVLWLAGTSLVTGQIHTLYGCFALVLLAPLFLLLAAWRIRSRRRHVLRLVIACLCLFVCLPFALISLSGNQAVAREKQETSNQSTAAVQAGSGDFIKTGERYKIKDPLRGFGGGKGWRYAWLAGGVIIGLLGSRRKSVGLLVAVLIVLSSIFFVPPLCSRALSVLGSPWILLRLDVVFFLIAPMILPAGVAYVVERMRPRYTICFVLSLVAFVAAFPWATHGESYNWNRYKWLASLERPRRVGNMEKLRGLSVSLSRHLPEGSTVLVEPSLGMHLVAAYDCRLVFPKRSSNGVPEGWRRRIHLELMLWGPFHHRRDSFLEQYGVSHLFYRDLPVWAQGRAELLTGTSYGTLWRLGADSGGEPG
ncbi:MAG: hypothetical protein ACYTHJ_06205 [Planctomycetota bacterium]